MNQTPDPRYAFDLANNLHKGGKPASAAEHWRVELAWYMIRSRRYHWDGTPAPPGEIGSLSDEQYARFLEIVKENLGNFNEGDPEDILVAYDNRFKCCILDTIAENGNPWALVGVTIWMMEKIANPVFAPKGESTREVNHNCPDVELNLLKRLYRFCDPVTWRLTRRIWTDLMKDDGRRHGMEPSIVNNFYEMSNGQELPPESVDANNENMVAEVTATVRRHRLAG